MKYTRHTALVILFLVTSSYSRLSAAETAPAAVPVAKIDNVVLTESDLRNDAGMSLYDAENQLFAIKRTWVDQKSFAILSAKAAKEANISLAEWQKREIDGKTVAPTSAEISQWSPRFSQTRSTQNLTTEQLNEANENARKYLLKQKRAQREAMTYAELTQKYGNPELFFVKPDAPHIELPITKKTLVKGPANAKVTIIEFTDFECPWCKRSQEHMKQVEAAFPNQVKYIDKMYPLQNHARAMPAAEAGYCAHEQGKYWEMREKLFLSASLTDADISQYAKEIGLNTGKFSSCLKSHKYVSVVEADMADAQRFGVKGTPAFYVNGAPTQFMNLTDTVRAAMAK